MNHSKLWNVYQEKDGTFVIESIFESQNEQKVMLKNLTQLDILRIRSVLNGFIKEHNLL